MPQRDPSKDIAPSRRGKRWMISETRVAELVDRCKCAIPGHSYMARADAERAYHMLHLKIVGREPRGREPVLAESERQIILSMTLEEVLWEVRSGSKCVEAAQERIQDGKYYGVDRKSGCKEYVVRMKTDGTTRKIFSSTNADDAARARDSAAVKRWGSAAILNFPEEHAPPSRLAGLRGRAQNSSGNDRPANPPVVPADPGTASRTPQDRPALKRPRPRRPAVERRGRSSRGGTQPPAHMRGLASEGAGAAGGGPMPPKRHRTTETAAAPPGGGEPAPEPASPALPAEQPALEPESAAAADAALRSLGIFRYCANSRHARAQAAAARPPTPPPRESSPPHAQGRGRQTRASFDSAAAAPVRSAHSWFVPGGGFLNAVQKVFMGAVTGRRGGDAAEDAAVRRVEPLAGGQQQRGSEDGTRHVSGGGCSSPAATPGPAARAAQPAEAAETGVLPACGGTTTAAVDAAVVVAQAAGEAAAAASAAMRGPGVAGQAANDAVAQAWCAAAKAAAVAAQTIRDANKLAE